MDASEREARAFNALNLRFSYSELARLRKEHLSWSAAAERSGVAEKAEDWDGLLEHGLRLVLLEDPSFPAALKEIPLPPFGLYVKGEFPPMRPLLAIVGTRKATAGGRRQADRFARELAAAGLGIASGLALGIDGAAHAGALAVRGYTLAVQANGLHMTYPRFHADLGKRILAEGGALVSEYAPGTPPLPHRFLERNRIVSGLARGVLVIEASDRSGSLVTARFALDQNRDVFAVPGPVEHPNYRGSHSLIRQGAELVTSPQEVLGALGIDASPAPREGERRGSGLSPEEEAVLGALSGAGAPLSIDKITELTHLNAQIAARAVSFLIIKRRAREEAGGFMLS